ncbi:hypothetical protein PIB30_078364 [Stylosanthes scabra]|uniref:Uncharacterized protein n=1 Tax=Stylosanthes scabra TaxID=79078 RepID=A0ABU6XNS4_9FABA|nr:hypothetical protein [Stylosanthes scabra]
MTDSTEVGKDEAIKLCGADSVSISALNTTEPCEKSLAGDNKVVTEVSSGDLGSGLERRSIPSIQCPDDRGDKPITVTTVTTVTVESKSSVQDSCTTTVNASLSSVGNSCSGLSFDTESKHMSLGKPLSAIYVEDLHATANSLSQNTSLSVPVQCDKTATQDQLSCTTEYSDGRNLHCHNPISNGDHQLPVPGNCVDRVDSVLHGYPLQMHIKKEVNGDIKCSSSANELPLLSRKNEQDDHFKSRLSYSSDSEKTSRNGDVKLFGKILTNPSSTHKPNLTTKSCEENGIHNPNSSSKLSSLKYADGNFKMLKFERDGCSDYLGLENVPVQSYGYWDGNRIQTGLSSLPDSAILLAKYPAAFSNYPSSSAKLEQQSFHAFGKNNERHLNGASAFTARDMNGSNAVIDYQMLRSRDGSMVDVKHCQDVFSEMPRRNGFEAISSLHQQQQQARGVMGMSSGVGVPGIVVGGSCSGVTDPVAAIKMHYSNSDKYGGQAGNNLSNRKDESWAGGKGDLGR